MILIFWIFLSQVFLLSFATKPFHPYCFVYIFKEYDESSITVQHQLVKHANVLIAGQLIQSIKETQKQFLSLQSQKSFENINSIPKVKINIGRSMQSFIKVNQTELIMIEVDMNYLKNESNQQKYRQFFGVFQGKNPFENTQLLQRMFVLQKGMTIQNSEKISRLLNITKQQREKLCQVDIKNLISLSILEQVQLCFQTLTSDYYERKQQASNNQINEYNNENESINLHINMKWMILTYFLVSILVLFLLAGYFIKKAKLMGQSAI